MPTNAKVHLQYGPYDSCGRVAHHTQRLDGLKNILAMDGHEVILEEIEDWNVVQLMVNGEIIFICDIRQLDFGGDGKLDQLCAEARTKVHVAF